MEKRKKRTAVITSITKEAQEIYSMWIKEADAAASARAGQFLSLYCKDGSRLLPRPISICEINEKEGTLRLVYRVVGKGTEEFSRFTVGDTLEFLGPLGNGFILEKKKALIIGGGIGIPPMLELSKQLQVEKQIILGYRDELFLNKEFESYGKIFLSTEDGSYGTKGNVIDAIKNNNLTADIIYACGPLPMLKGVKAFAREKGIPAQISLEERMACGIGACLGCVCKSREKDTHTNVNNKRVCKDGPVFDSEEVEI